MMKAFLPTYYSDINNGWVARNTSSGGLFVCFQKTLEQVLRLTLGQETVLLTETFSKESAKSKRGVRNSEEKVKNRYD